MGKVTRTVLLRWAAVAAWLTLIFVLSAQPQLPDLTPGLPGFEEVVGHLTGYGVLAGLIWWALRGTAMRYPATWALVAAVGYGITDEFHQSFVPGRTMSAADLLVDLIGASLVLLALTWIQARRLATAAR